MKKAIIILLMLSVTRANSKELIGSIESIPDGDTIKIAGKSVRFNHIDTPECGQVPYGNLSRDHLMTMLSVGDVVRVEYNKTGKYGRIIGVVYKGNVNINLKMVEDGYAYWYYKYSHDKTYHWAELNALDSCKGIVCDMNIRPWDYRKQVPWSIRKNLHCK